MYIATETFQAGINYGVETFESGVELDDDLGRHLASIGCPVQPLEDPQPTVAAKAAKKTPAKKAAAKPADQARPLPTHARA